MAEDRPTPPSQVQIPPVQQPAPPFTPTMVTNGDTRPVCPPPTDRIPRDYGTK